MSGKFKLFFCSVFLFLCFQSAAFAVTTESLDSIGIQKIEGRTYIIHKVVNQETLFSISRRYKVQMSEIQQANEILKQGMKEGQMLLVPYRPINSSSGSSEPSSPSTATPVTVPAAPARNTASENAADPPNLKTAKGKGDQSQGDVSRVQLVHFAIHFLFNFWSALFGSHSLVFSQG
jgi:hypothetical protein